MKKHINSASKQYQDEYTDNWVLDDTPTKCSFNAVTSDGVAKAIEQGGGSSYEAGDGIAINEGTISTKVDGTTININADGALEAIGGGGGGSLPTPTNTSQLLGVRTNHGQYEPAWLAGTALKSQLNVAGANTWQSKSYDAEGEVEWTVNVASNVITLTPDTPIVPNNRSSHFYIQYTVMLQQLSSSWTGGLIHADVDFKYKCTGIEPQVDRHAYDRHRVVRVTQYEATRWPELQIAAELLITNQEVSRYQTWNYLFDMGLNCGISEVTITITDDSGNALPVISSYTDYFPVLAWLD